MRMEMRMHKRMGRLRVRAVRTACGLTVLAAVAGGISCRTLGRQMFKEPVVRLRSVKLVGAGIGGGTLDVALSVFNPNDFRLDATKLTYRVLADTVLVGHGETDRRFTVQQGDSTIVTLPVEFNYNGLGEVGRQILMRGLLNYRVMGDVTVSTPIGSFIRPYDQAGRFAVGGQ
jgi:LEA14-like dessication related protein